MSFLLLILLIFLLLLILFPMIGSRILQNIFRSLLGLPKQPFYRKQKDNAHYQKSETSSKKKKIIGKEEGEYIDYEEVIEDKK